MFNTEHLQEKWSPVLAHPDLPKIEDSYKRAVTTVILENQEKAIKEDRSFLQEAAPTNSTGADVENWDPILISLVRRSMPNLIAYDICGVQPMTGPTGLIFAMKARYQDYPTGSTRLNQTEAMGVKEVQDASHDHGRVDGESGLYADREGDPFAGSNAYKNATPTGMSTDKAEALGDSATNEFAEMSFTIEKSTVTAVSRALKAEYTLELAQDLKAIHGLDAESELANIFLLKSLLKSTGK